MNHENKSNVFIKSEDHKRADIIWILYKTKCGNKLVASLRNYKQNVL